MWTVDGFLARFDLWVERDDPDADVQLATMAWIHGLQDRPHRGAKRRLDLGTIWWFTEIQGTDSGDEVTTCLYRIDEVARIVSCSVIATLRFPID